MESTTKSQTTELTSTVDVNNFANNVKIYLLNPISSGLVGFAAFFTLIILTKLFNYIFGIQATFSIDFYDVIYALTGFVLGAGVKFLEFFSKES